MKNRRTFVKAMAAAVTAVMVLVAPAIAEELLGVLTKIDVAGKKITVVEKGTDKEIEVKITDETETVGKKGAQKVDLEKLEGFLKKRQESGAKGIEVKVEHEKGVASKLTIVRKKAAN